MMLENGEYKGLQVGKVSNLFQEVRDAVQQEGVPLETALQVITSNPAHVLKHPQKGIIQKGNDADIVLIEKNTLEIKTLIAKGQK
jgi:beta-aspartyl-dipeptidase (metallo-type)